MVIKNNLKKLNITFCSFPDFSSHAKPLYEYMKKKYHNKMNFTWIVRTEEMFKLLKEKNISVFKLGTAEYYTHMETTDVIFSTHADLILEKREGALYIELWHGIGSKKCGYLLEKLPDYDQVWYKEVSKKVDYFIVPTDFWAIIFSSIFNVKRERVLTLGYPKIDSIKNLRAKEILFKILNIKYDNQLKIIFYTPTLKKREAYEIESVVNTDNVFDLELYDEKILIDFLEKNNYLLCIKLHPSDELSYKIPVTSNIRVISDKDLAKNGKNINDILNAADLLITDYSSLGVEFVFLDKPVIIISAFIDSFNINRGLFFKDPDFWSFNERITCIENLLIEITNSLNNFNLNNETLKLKKSLWYGNLKNGGCKNICEYIFKNYQINNENITYYYDIETQLNKIIDDLKCSISYREKELNQLNKSLGENEKEIKFLKSRLDVITNSKAWKILEFLRKFKISK